MYHTQGPRRHRDFEAVGLPEKGRGARTSEFLDIMKLEWTSERPFDWPVEDPGEFGVAPVTSPRSPRMFLNS